MVYPQIGIKHFGKKSLKGVVDDLLKSGRYRPQGQELSIDLLLEKPHGIDLGPLQPNLPEAIFHE